MAEIPKIWQDVKESGVGGFRIAVFVFCLKFFGRKAARLLVFIVFLFSFPFLSVPRKISADFLARVQAKTHKKYSVFRHLLSFAYALLDKLAAWTGEMELKNLRQKNPEVWAEIGRDLAENRGVFLICSHLGNIEALRAAFLALPRAESAKLNIIMSLTQTEKFNRIMRKINPAAGDCLISVNSAGPDVAMLAEEKIGRGEIVVMAADRAPQTQNRGATFHDFIGAPAAFPDGAFRFVGALGCPVFAVFLLESPEKPFAPELSMFPLEVPAGTPARAAAKIRQAKFVSILEELTLKNPYQWFNFFDFWRAPENPK